VLLPPCSLACCSRSLLPVLCCVCLLAATKKTALAEYAASYGQNQAAPANPFPAPTAAFVADYEANALLDDQMQAM
jgi:hypothetical protein